MKRNFEKILTQWHEKKVRKPLIVRGMRQTGVLGVYISFFANFLR